MHLQMTINQKNPTILKLNSFYRYNFGKALSKENLRTLSIKIVNDLILLH
jgi:hypothetical protein